MDSVSGNDLYEEPDMNNETQRLLEALADLFEYPDPDLREALDRAQRLIAHSEERVAIPFIAFTDIVGPMSLEEVQEAYIRTFELSAICTLEVGFHLFGESYKRGEFLAHLRAEEDPFELRQDSQLPDYLPVLLRLVGHLSDAELCRDLVGACILPATAKMGAALDEKQSAYMHLIATVTAALEIWVRGELETASEDPAHVESTIEAEVCHV